MRRARTTLAVSVAGAMLVALDGTVLTVAYPTLRHDLHATFAQVQWSSTAYLIAVAATGAALATRLPTGTLAPVR
ncbi:hypothetical protein [Phytohabitans houttuyneae]|uniref:Major facilitator superfamily (MFS) profile domain-containing protein n=1 Tax=Phytohabitans houttuyneae TaxID=1076126 RepID=A0A6V8KNX5_9ACTN|nr:hypothetical protein [Phytohabitans houttuyneae]GFJ84071.1 hypothetical protein Phou_082510 [Phytohabitans houttuyneae]